MRRKVRISHPSNVLHSWVAYLSGEEIDGYRNAGWIVAEVDNDDGDVSLADRRGCGARADRG